MEHARESNSQHQVHPAVVRAAAEAKPKRPKTEYTPVTMDDGRVVQFAGKVQMYKDIFVYDENGAEVEFDSPQAAAVKVRFDFRNGRTLWCQPPDTLLFYSAGHGLSQKVGDETAGDKGNVDDMILHVENMIEVIQSGKWTTREPGEGDSFSGSHIVIKALVQLTGKSVEDIKAYLKGKLDAAKAKGESLSRKQLYDSFRNPKTKTGQLIRKLEEEANSSSAVDADSELAALQG